MYDILIIGAGPAGISASLYAKRAGRSVLVLYSGESQLEKAHSIDNYYGFTGGITGRELFDTGIAQAKALGVDVKKEEALHISSDGKAFEIKTDCGVYSAAAVILATGSKKLKPNIKGIEEFDAKGISYCAICDGFFFRNKKVAVIGNGDYALSEAGDLENIVSEVLILTDGLDAPDTDKYSVVTDKIAEITGDKRVGGVVFENGETLELDGIFVALGSAGGADFAKKLGVALNGDKIKVNDDMSTNVPGLFSCGDITGGLLQVSKAVYEGAQAGLSAVKYVKEKDAKGE